MNDVKHTGIIKLFKKENGFGFITSGNKDYFFHFSGFAGDQNDIAVGEAVSFNVKKCRRGRGVEAVNIVSEILE